MMTASFYCVEKLSNDRKCQLSRDVQMQVTLQTALGMNYLHLSDPQIIHLDLKSQNLLVRKFVSSYCFYPRFLTIK